MTPEELRAAVTFANGIDPRVQMTAPNAELWGRVVGDKQAIEVKAAIQVYYERPRVGGREHPPIDPASVKRIIAEETGRIDAIDAARSALPPARHPSGWRARNPAQWDRLVQQGRDDHLAWLQGRGIPLNDDQLARARNRTEAVPIGAASSIPGGES